MMKKSKQGALGLVPPPQLWPDSGKGKIGPTALQRMYFIDRLPPNKRPHLHTLDILLSVGGFGSGKSFRKGTPVLTFQGSVVNIEDVKVGDLLMGPDSTPRKVLDLGRGREVFYKVTPTKGEPFYCNESHILSLKYSSFNEQQKRVRKDGSIYIKPPRYGGKEVINVPITEYLSWSKRKQSQFLLYRSEAVTFINEETLPIDPYIFGLWLGDGSKSTFAITSVDPEIIDVWRQYGRSLGKELSIYDDGVRVPLYKIPNEVQSLRKLGVFENKHIPHTYKTSSIENRRKLLAGLIDSDGYQGSGSVEISQKSKVLAQDIAFIARSLGLAAYIKEYQGSCTYRGEKRTGTYYKVSISGEMSNLPVLLARKKCTPRQQKKSVLSTGFSLEKLPEDDYYGVVLDGDHLFLLGDFTVVHNTVGEIVRIVDTCLRFPGTKALIGGIDLQALKRNVIDLVGQIFALRGEPFAHPEVTNVLSDKQTVLKFANGSRLSLVNLTDFMKVVGLTVGIMGVEEPHILPEGEEGFKTLISRLRGNKPDIRQMILCTNPQTTSDGWMNKVFELEKLEFLDTSNGPVEMLVGKPCECQVCISCKLQNKGEFTWVRGFMDGASFVPDEISTDLYCPNCLTVKDFYKWKGEKYHCPGNQQYMRVIKSESMHNQHIPADVLQSMRDQYDDATFDIFVKGAVNKNLREDYLFTKFDKDIHMLEDLAPINWYEDIYWGLDFNRKPQSSVICQVEEFAGRERFICKAEICLFGRPTIDNAYGSGGADAQEVAREFVKRYKKSYQGTTIYLYGDPKGFNLSSSSSKHNYEIIAQHLEEEGFDVQIACQNKQIGIKDRIACTEYWLDSEFLMFNPKDQVPWTYLSVKEYKWDSKDVEGRQPDKKQDWNVARATSHKTPQATSHFGDALSCMLFQLFPLTNENQRSATLPDGTTIREDRRGKLIIEKGFSTQDAPEGSWEHALAQLKAGKEELAPTTMRGLLGISIPVTANPDDNGL